MWIMGVREEGVKEEGLKIGHLTFVLLRLDMFITTWKSSLTDIDQVSMAAHLDRSHQLYLSES